jgi:predicted transcriptional regulator
MATTSRSSTTIASEALRQAEACERALQAALVERLLREALVGLRIV